MTMRYTYLTNYILCFFILSHSFWGLSVWAEVLKNKYIEGMYSFNHLIEAKEISHESYALRYYLGMLYLKKGNYNAAYIEFQQYMKLNPPQDEKYKIVQEKLVTIQQKTHLQLKKVLQHNDQKNIAVLEFSFVGDEKYKELPKGFSSMIITDLSKIPELNLVERIKMNALINEINFVSNGVIDKTNAPKAGKLLMAQKIIWGNMAIHSKDFFEISTILTETSTDANNIGRSKSTGSFDTFFKVQKDIVFKLLEFLGIKKQDLDTSVIKDIEKYHTNHLDAVLSYSRGLDFQDRGIIHKARESFRKALKEDPNFELAKKAESALPDYHTFVETKHTEKLVKRQNKDSDENTQDTKENDNESQNEDTSQNSEESQENETSETESEIEELSQTESTTDTPDLGDTSSESEIQIPDDTSESVTTDIPDFETTSQEDQMNSPSAQVYEDPEIYIEPPIEIIEIKPETPIFPETP
jgi:tetratricopeptide (TPR) repeat protein